MLLVFDPGGELLHRLTASTFSSRAVVQRWDDLHRFTPAADCCVVFLRGLDEPEELRRLERYRRAFPAKPTVLVLERRPENLPFLHRLPAWEVVWLADVEREVCPAVRRAIHASLPFDANLAPGGGGGDPAPALPLAPEPLKSRLGPDDHQRWRGKRLAP